MKFKIKNSKSHSHLHFNINNNLLKCKRSNSNFDFLFGNKNLLKSKFSNSHLDFQIENNNLLKSKRSQSAMEFVILIAFVLFFFTAFSLVIQGNMSDKLREKKNLAVKEIALTVQDEINLAQESSEGYFRTFKLPKNLNGQDYIIELNEGMVYIHTLDNKYAMALPIADVTVVNLIQKGFNNITKENGEVKLNP